MSSLLRMADEINAVLERHFWVCSVLFVALFLSCAIFKDIRTKMKLDEFYTLQMAHQASLEEIVKATVEGCDGAPPLYAMVVRAILPWVRPEALAVRLPATLGYCGMILCLLIFCRRRLTAVYSLLAALLACNASSMYSVEGRGYGVVLGCAAGALLCWQAAADGKRRIVAIPLLAFCLALMTAMHYYAIFFLVPLLLAELVRWRTSGKLDFAVLAAMASVPLVLGLHYPLIAASKPFQQQFWSPALWSGIPPMYATYFLDMCLAPMGLLAVFCTMPDGPRDSQPGLTLPEWVAMGGFSLMPFCVVVLSRYTTHVFVVRYTLWAVTGIAILIAALLCVSARGKSIVGVSTLALLVALIAWREMNILRQRPVLRQGQAEREALELLPDSAEPIVVAGPLEFMALSYYVAPRVRERLTYANSRDLEMRYLGYDTVALMFSALSHRSKLHITGYDEFLAAHPRFVLAATPEDYLPWHLVKAGYSVVPIGSSLPPVLYEVEAQRGK